MEFLTRLLHRRKRRPYEPALAKCFSDFLFGRDEYALTRSRNLLPDYFLAFTQLFGYALTTGEYVNALEDLYDRADAGCIPMEAVTGVEMTLFAVTCACGCVLSGVPTYEDWCEFDSRLEDARTKLAPDEQQGYIDFANRLIASIKAIESSPNGVVDRPVLRVAIVSAVLFACELEEGGIGWDSGWLDGIRVLPAAGSLTSNQLAESINRMFWGVTNPLGFMLDRYGTR